MATNFRNILGGQKLSDFKSTDFSSSSAAPSLEESKVINTPAQLMRKQVAAGNTPLQATLTEASENWGAAAKVQNWLQLTAHQRGLTVELAQLLEDPTVTDVVINSTTSWVDKGSGLERVDLGFQNEGEVRQLANRLAAAAGRRLDEASPILDGTIEGGIRIHAVIPPVAKDGTLISLRAHKRKSITLEQMVQANSLPIPLLEVLLQLVNRGASILVSGATGSGKTTLLSALLAKVSSAQRIVCIEEAAELHPAHPHVVHLQERQQNVEGSGQITLSNLVRAAMRMRPDRLVLGECRGPEVRDVLTALNTGHQGGMATIHANSVQDVPSRLIALGALAGLDALAISALAASALDVVIQMKRQGKTRYISSLGVLTQMGQNKTATTNLMENTQNAQNLDSFAHQESSLYSGNSLGLLVCREILRFKPKKDSPHTKKDLLQTSNDKITGRNLLAESANLQICSGKAWQSFAEKWDIDKTIVAELQA